jgi:erythromycin esterase-like protein
MLGEASHGTHEFYTWRAALTRRLIEERGFSFVAVEGDWPDCERVDRSVRGAPGAPADPREALLAFERWPTWMWANEEVVDFCRWLRAHNERAARPVGFHGLDVYSLWESLREILVHLHEHDPDEVPGALAAYRCFEPYGESPQAYAFATRFVPATCESEVIRLLVELRERATDFDIVQNAEVVAGAERYYRAMVHGGPKSWNVRDRHMDDTLARLLDHYDAGGARSRGVVWAHNTHIGDSRATDQSEHGEVTIGELARDRYGPQNVVLVGFGSHRGTVIAADSWGAAMTGMEVPPARENSIEDVLHAAAPPQGLIVVPPFRYRPDVLVDAFGHRAIGVIYRPGRERSGNYVPTVLGDRYDAFLWFDETRAVRPLHTRSVDVLEPETYPTGV